MPDDPIQLRRQIRQWRQMAVIATTLFGLTAFSCIAFFAPEILELKESALQRQADIAELALGVQTCKTAEHLLDELQVDMAEIVASNMSTVDFTADVTADDLLAMVDCAATCVAEPRGDPLCDYEDDLTDLLMGVCALGWLQAGDLMFESESNYQGCKHELEAYQRVCTWAVL